MCDAASSLSFTVATVKGACVDASSLLQPAAPRRARRHCRRRRHHERQDSAVSTSALLLHNRVNIDYSTEKSENILLHFKHKQHLFRHINNLTR